MMKDSVNRMVVLWLWLAFLCSAACGQTLTKKQEKGYRKQCAQEAKVLKKEGWVSLDDSCSMEEALLRYSLYIAKGNGMSDAIVVSNADKSENRAAQKVVLQAQKQYASRANARVSASQNYRIRTAGNGQEEAVEDFSMHTRTNSSLKVVLPKPVLRLRRVDEYGFVELRYYYIFDQN